MSLGALALLAIFAVTLLIDVPVAFGLVLASVAYLLLFDAAPTMVAAQQFVSGLDSFTLLAIPLFVLAAQLMNSAGLTQRIVRLCAAIVGDVPGGLAIVAVLACMMFGALSGSGVADVVAIGSLMLPTMAQRGYDRGFSAALVGCAGASSTIIPPSIVLIVYGTITDTSVGKLFMAGIIPGLLLGLSLIVVAVWMSRKHGWSGGQPFNAKELRASFFDALPALMVPVLIIGGIRFGIFTATEAASSAIVYALLIGAFWYRSLSFKKLWNDLKVTAEISASILLIIGAAALFAWILIAEQLPHSLAQFLVNFTDSKYGVMLLIMAVLLVLGTFMEAIALIIIVAPVVMPAIHHFGIDPVHFGILLVVNLAIGANTPPLGVDLLAACRIGGIRMVQTLRPLSWMVLAMLSVLLLLMFVPSIVMFLPNTVA